MKRRVTEHELRRELAEVSKTIWERGWVANHDGNASARISEGRYLATPTALSKRVIAPDMLLVLDDGGKVIRGRHRVFSEIGLHRAVYRDRSDAAAVLHAHPPYATARSVTGQALPCFLAEAVVSLGELIPLVPFAVPGADAEKNLAAFTNDHDAVLLENHGVLTWGDDPEQAFLRMELVEHLAKIAHLAGALRPLPKEAVGKLLEARHKAGLGPRARARSRPPD
jgi:L-fuculose-phosphate aldolase